MLQWLIIGGGLHGVHIATALIEQAALAPEALRILDPGPRLLSRWRACTAATGMRYLRSPAVHHLDLNPWSLQRFAGKPQRRHKKFAPPYDRPSLELFNAHCDEVILRHGLDKLHIQGFAQEITLLEGGRGACVLTSSGQRVEAEHIILAIGSSEQLKRPSWAGALPTRSRHLYDPMMRWSRDAKGEHMGVIGGGISACQAALRLLKRSDVQVTIFSEHPLREHQFDSDPGWLGPKFMHQFERTHSHDERRALIQAARHKGSAPPDVIREVKQALRSTRLRWETDPILDAQEDDEGLTLHTATGQARRLDRIILATGFDAQRPGGPMLDALIERADLPCARCGYPIVDTALRWHQRIFTTGPLAELELGPSARNIAGARRAAERICAYAQRASLSREGK